MWIITGGAGFLGSAFLWELNRRGIDDVLIVDNLSTSEKWQNLVHCNYLDYMHRDRFRELLKGSMPFQDIKGIVHLGACSSTTEKDADFLIDNNFHYSQEVCRFALERGARFINASSAATYGDGELGFLSSPDILAKLRPLNMYGYSKHLFDLWLTREGLADKVASIKFFNVYGPNEYHKGLMASVVFKLYNQIKTNGSVQLFASNTPALKNGEQSRDFVYVKDCVKLMAWLMLERPDVHGFLNVGTGRAETFNAVARAVFRAMDKNPIIDYCRMPEALNAKYQNYTCADMDWLRKAGYRDNFCGIEAGIDDYVKNYLSAPNPYLDCEYYP